jgi:hypothetical protein
MRTHQRAASVVGVIAIGLLAMAPAVAAAPVSQAGANALTVAVAGHGQGSGDVTATNDGSQETKSGNAAPPLSILQGQTLFQGGALAQEATARTNGTAAACAGLAGNGGSVVNIGDSHCLNPGDEVHATLGNLDLSHLVLADTDSALAPLNDPLTAALTNLQPLTDAINQGLDAARAQLGDLGIVAGFGVVEGSCTATASGVDGDARLADAGIVLQAPDRDVTLLDLPVHPAPNTHLFTNLSGVVDAVLDAVDTDVTSSLDGNASQLTQLTAALREQVVTHIHDEMEANLAPLEQNLLDVTLNKQTRSAGSIKVSALDLQLVPAAVQQVGASLASIQIGNVTCGPSAEREAAAAAPTPGTTSSLPRSVSAGLASAPGQHPAQDHTGVVLGALAIMTVGGAGLVLMRRLAG